LSISKALGVTSVMLTGDNTATAKAIAAQAGIDDARGDLLPEAKLDAIKEMQKRYGATGMTGDGINDAPALHRPTSVLPWAAQEPTRPWKRPMWSS
jgi:P-type E1-E2 ATPase